VNLENVHFIGLYCIIILDSTNISGKPCRSRCYDQTGSAECGVAKTCEVPSGRLQPRTSSWTCCHSLL